eukprot:SAG31_NODE_703_length_12720_cov_10.185088_10_plen_219_part_00
MQRHWSIFLATVCMLDSQKRRTHVQGFIGTCYFLAALADVAAVANGALIRRLIIDSHASMGLYGVRFYVRGRWITVAVDDHFPVFFRSGRRCDDRLEPLEACFEPISARFTKRRFVGGHAKESSLRVIWPLLMEKAFAKMVGTYDAANGDISLVDCMRYLLGGLTSGCASFQFDVAKQCTCISNLSDRNCMIPASSSELASCSMITGTGVSKYGKMGT